MIRPIDQLLLRRSKAKIRSAFNSSQRPQSTFTVYNNMHSCASPVKNAMRITKRLTDHRAELSTANANDEYNNFPCFVVSPLRKIKTYTPSHNLPTISKCNTICCTKARIRTVILKPKPDFKKRLSSFNEQTQKLIKANKSFSIMDSERQNDFIRVNITHMHQNS